MFIGCQHHILYKVLQHVMNEELNVGKTRSPNIEYNFVLELLENYDELKPKLKQSTGKLPKNES